MMQNQISRIDTVKMDNCDPLAPFRDRFKIPEGLIYLDGNSLGPLPKATTQKLGNTIENEWGSGLINSWVNADWLNAPTRIGNKIAKLIGAKEGEVIAADSTSINLFKAIMAALSLQSGRNIILSETGNFTTDIYLMQGLEQFLPDRVEAKLVNPDVVIDAITDNVAVLLLTQVHYKTAAIHDMVEITQRAHDKGVLVIWDLSHSIGSIPIELNACNVDFAAGCGYKFLNGGPGCPGFLFVAERHHDKALPILSGWFSHEKPFNFDDDYRPAHDATKFLCGTPHILGLTALEQGLEITLEASIIALREKAITLSNLFINLMEESLGEKGFTLVSPKNPDKRGGHVSYAHQHAYSIMKALNKHKVVGDFRAPDILRFGITPLYLRYQDIYDSVAILKSIMESQEYLDPEYAYQEGENW